MNRISRRRLLGFGATALGLAGLAAAGVETDILPAWVRLHSALGLNGVPARPPGAKTELITGSFHSAARSTQVGWTIAFPPDLGKRDPLPVLVALHGRFTDHLSLFGDRIGLDHYLASDQSLRFAIAAADGGDTYCHPRRSGEDSAAMITDEFLPLLAERGLATERIGLYGFSMGGLRALRLAGLLGPDRVAAVVAVSSALFVSATDFAPGAFDGAEDFAANDVMHRQSQLIGIPVRLDCGNGDSFKSAVKRYRDGFPDNETPSGGFQAGAHDENWRRMAPTELSFVNEHLAG